jgi:hypothetical protein
VLQPDEECDGALGGADFCAADLGLSFQPPAVPAAVVCSSSCTVDASTCCPPGLPVLGAFSGEVRPVEGLPVAMTIVVESQPSCEFSGTLVVDGLGSEPLTGRIASADWPSLQTMSLELDSSLGLSFPGVFWEGLGDCIVGSVSGGPFGPVPTGLDLCR